MERSRSRLPAGAAALLLVLSVSGAAGADALISTAPDTVPLQKSGGSGQDRAKESVKTGGDQTDVAAADAEQLDGAEGGADEPDEGRQRDRGTSASGDECQTTEGGAAGTRADSTGNADATSIHGAAVSEVARDTSVVGGPRQNHGYCVSRVARGVEAEAGPEQEKPRPTCDTATAPESGGAGSANGARNHGAAVSVVARSDAVARKTDASGQVVDGSTCNHGHAVAAVARQNHGHAQRATARSERAGNGRTSASGQGATKVKAHRKTKVQREHRPQPPNGKGRGRGRR